MLKVYGVIGDPIAHSLSPIMHNQEFEALGIDAKYLPFHVKEKDLADAVKGMKAIGIAGFNVTIPHKEAIIPLLDDIDSLAKAIGAVNTVVRKNDRFIGYNTDGEGFFRALQEEWKEEIKNERVLIIGAGGAAKAIYFTLLAKGITRIDICNRSLERAERLVSECPYEGKTKILTCNDASKEIGNYDLVIQTTSVGMHPLVHNLPISLEYLNKNTFVSDIIYNPLETALLKEAKKYGAKVQNGIGMFVYQGALAFEKWTGKAPNIQRMKKTVIKQLRGTTC